ncbi:MAG: YifB family Mg chelatase-like AAA ATPase, partial [Firmicutes bacterium]|nr:YifB family Mg chelatase-like AAA ATPase [Bacillota bacterium]
MLAKIHSCALNGLDGYGLTVEVDVGIGLSAFELVGLPDASVRESRERVRAAVKNSGFDFPLRRITVNLAPADIRKEGPSLDLPIAVGILAATQQIDINEYLLESAFVGELSLDGLVRPITGALPIADYLSHNNRIKRLFLPEANAVEAAIVDGIEILPLHDLHQLTRHLAGAYPIDSVHTDVDALFRAEREKSPLDFSEVRGQDAAKRALEVAVAGGHNVLMIGSPGSGKTMLARRLPTIMPELTLEESIECTKIYSVSGNLPAGAGLLTERPFRSPHHGASAVSIIGGGAVPRPGEITLASHGVLFLDELPEFRRDVLEALRQPLEDRVVTVSRASGRADFPADFMLVAAMNPCPCGFWGDDLRDCTCTPLQRRRYLSKLSGPLLDRIDLHIHVPRVEYKAISSTAKE